VFRGGGWSSSAKETRAADRGRDVPASKGSGVGFRLAQGFSSTFLPLGPLLAGVGDVTNPTLIPETKIPPAYPERARASRAGGNVILQLIVRADGTVGDIEVLRCSRPDMGFEESAMRAVKQWRYAPATQDGLPVEVYFTVFVEFKLQ
jgi:protein TonB